MIRSKLEELLTLAGKASPGPWTSSGQDGVPGHCYMAQVWDAAEQALASIEPTPDEADATATAAFIAAANPSDIRALCERLIELEDAGWQDISTAPRDRNILVYFRDGWGQDRVQEAWWKSPYEGAPLERCSWETMKGTLLSADVHRTMDAEKRPLGATHWRPLPKPPTPPAIKDDTHE